VTRRFVPIGALLIAAPLLLGGCLLNTPTNVSKRFIGAVKRLQWGKMEALVDWPSSERALGRSLRDGRKEILTTVAEYISGYEIRRYGEGRAKSHFVFFNVAEAEDLERTVDYARLRITLKLSSDVSKEFEMTTHRVGRTWRVVLTPNLLKREYVDY
jgi:hypothetical protein